MVEGMILDIVENSPPVTKVNKTMCLISEKAYTARKRCGRNSSRTVHTTGACGCGMLGQRKYSCSYLLQISMRTVMSGNGNNNEKHIFMLDAGTSTEEVMMATIQQCTVMDKEEDNPNQSHFTI